MATAMIAADVGRPDRPSSAGWRRASAVLGGAAALSFAVWTMAISWSVSGPVWWQEASSRLVGMFVVVTGVAMWIRQPIPRMGQLVVFGGAVYYLQYLRVADGTLFVIGFCLAYAWVGVTGHIALAWPTGTLEGRIDRIYVVCSYLASAGTQIIRYLVDRPRPPWAMHIAKVNTLWAVVGSTTAAALGVLGIALLVYRWIGSTPVRRRPSGPVWTALAVAAIFKIAEAISSILSAPVAVQATLASLFYLAVIVLIPLLYLIRWLHRKFAHQRVMALLLDLECDLELIADPAALQRALSRTLGDPRLTLSYPLPTGDYVDIHGQLVDPGRDIPGRSLTRVQRRGQLVAVIDHDSALHEQPQITEAAVATAGLAIENAHLYATMQAHLEQIRTSRLRLAQTAFDERQRIQRDLHDEAQQRFFKVLMLLDNTTRQLVGGDDMRTNVVATVRQAHAELTDAIRVLREVTQGIYPAVLINHGLAAAVENLADRAPLPLRITVGTQSWPKHVEITAYFVISEALTNVYKHANATRATVTVRNENGQLVAEITDDGRGGAHLGAGFGLTSLRDRVEAVGGNLVVHSEPDQGTKLVAVLPRST
ncbi:MAG: sensor histidine kinase [Pseudonocardiaceae bacterium]